MKSDAREREMDKELADYEVQTQLDKMTKDEMNKRSWLQSQRMAADKTNKDQMRMKVRQQSMHSHDQSQQHDELTRLVAQQRLDEKMQRRLNKQK